MTKWLGIRKVGYTKEGIMIVAKHKPGALARPRARGRIQKRVRKDVERVAEAFAEALVLALMDQAERLAAAIGRGMARAGQKIRDRFSGQPALPPGEVIDEEEVEHPELDS
ncbi:MAG: hypothetical protein ABIQ16_13000 [Polyangiaceae bacterium]